MLTGFSAVHTLNPGIMDAFANSITALQMILKALGLDFSPSGKADTARLHTGDKVCGSCVNA